jgi:hypothetical protein
MLAQFLFFTVLIFVFRFLLSAFSILRLIKGINIVEAGLFVAKNWTPKPSDRG